MNTVFWHRLPKCCVCTVPKIFEKWWNAVKSVNIYAYSLWLLVQIVYCLSVPARDPGNHRNGRPYVRHRIEMPHTQKNQSNHCQPLMVDWLICLHILVINYHFRAKSALRFSTNSPIPSFVIRLHGFSFWHVYSRLWMGSNRIDSQAMLIQA